MFIEISCMDELMAKLGPVAKTLQIDFGSPYGTELDEEVTHSIAIAVLQEFDFAIKSDDDEVNDCVKKLNNNRYNKKYSKYYKKEV